MDERREVTECRHKQLKKQLVGKQFWYRCETCPQKFKAESWDGKVEVIKAATSVEGLREAEPSTSPTTGV